MNIPNLVTERLLLRPLCHEDAPQIQEKFPHWEIVKYLSVVVPWPYPDDGAEDFIRDIALPAMARGEAWHWSIRPKSAPSELIGVISLRKGVDNRGFWLAPNWQKQGIMSEAAIAVTDFWFDVLGEEIMRIPKAIENEGSVKISQRSNMRPIRTEIREYVGGKMISQIWEIAKEEWHDFRNKQRAT